jgi:hypothetical protein
MANLPWVRYFVPYDRKELSTLVGQAIFANASDAERAERVRAYVSKFIQIELDLAYLVDGDSTEISQATKDVPSNLSSYDQEPGVGVTQEDHSAIPPSIAKLALEGYSHPPFTRPVEHIAWARTFVEALGPNGDLVSTPREFFRWYSHRCLNELLDPRTLLADIEAITLAIRKGGPVQELVWHHGQEMARAVFGALQGAGVHRFSARKRALTWLGALAQRVPLREWDKKEVAEIRRPAKEVRIIPTDIGEAKEVLKKSVS